MLERQVLLWKYEDGPEDAVAGSPLDVGPGWIDTYEDDKHVSGEQIAGGEWLTRAEAQAIAAKHGYEFVADDGAEDRRELGEGLIVDLVSLNQALRGVGVTEDELKVERIGNSYAVSGSRADTKPAGPSEFTFRSLHLARDEAELIEILTPLAPECQPGQ